MYEIVPLIDTRTGVVRYPGAGCTSVMTGGVRIGPCAEKGMEVMEMLEVIEIIGLKEGVERVEREDAWRADTPGQYVTSPVRLSRLCTRVSSSTTTPRTATDSLGHQVHLSTLVDLQASQQPAGIAAVARALHGPALAPPSYVFANPYTLQPSPGPYAWYGLLAIGNAYTHSPDANANTNGSRYFRPLSVAALSPLIPVAAAPPVEMARPTAASNSNNTPQGFYKTQEIEAHFLKGPELATPPIPTVYDAPTPPKERHRHAVRKQARIGLDGFISHSGGFRTIEPLEEPQSPPRPDPAPATTAAGIERPASTPPIRFSSSSKLPSRTSPTTTGPGAFALTEHVLVAHVLTTTTTAAAASLIAIIARELVVLPRVRCGSVGAPNPGSRAFPQR